MYSRPHLLFGKHAGFVGIAMPTCIGASLPRCEGPRDRFRMYPTLHEGRQTQRACARAVESCPRASVTRSSEGFRLAALFSACLSQQLPAELYSGLTMTSESMHLAMMARRNCRTLAVRADS